MAGKNILVVEDESDIAELVKYNLESAKFNVSLAATGEDGLRAIQESSPDLVLLDLMLPGLSGLEICAKVKADAKLKEIPMPNSLDPMKGPKNKTSNDKQEVAPGKSTE